jgi:hypothetical protein
VFFIVDTKWFIIKLKKYLKLSSLCTIGTSKEITMDTMQIANMATELSAAKTSYEASIKVAKKALDVQEQTGQSILKLLDSGNVNKAQEGRPTGTNIDFLA